MRDFYQEIVDIIGAGGEPCCVFPAADSLFEATDFLTFLTKGQGALDGLTATYSEDRRDFDAPAIYVRNPSRIPIRWQLNGTDEWASTPDIAAFSRDDTGSNPMSMGGLLQIADTGAARQIFSKFGNNGDREWESVILASERLRLGLHDDSAGITVFAEFLTVTPEVPVFVVSTYDANASAKSAAADDITIYINGAAVSSTKTNNASYEGMEALAAVVYVGARARSGVSQEFDGSLSTVFFTHRLLSAAEVFNLNDIYVAMQRATPRPVWRR